MDRNDLEDLLGKTRFAMGLAKKLMKSEDEEIQVRALEAYISLLELEASLITALGQSSEKETYFLSRKIRG